LSQNTPKRKAFARHGRLAVQSRKSAFWGLFVKVAAVLVGASVAIAGLSVADIVGTIQSNGIALLDSNGNAVNAVTAADLKGPINMLIVGSDTRQGQGGGFGHEASNLADVIILLHISADRKNAVAISFPRDTMVPFPACPASGQFPGSGAASYQQINASYAYGGPGCTLLVVQQLVGVNIPYLATINFKGVIEMSNAIGGVDVCVANPIIDTYTHLNIPAGMHTLQGREALQFLRTRHGVGDGSDLGRISNQQVYLTSLVRKVKSQGVLANPVYLYSLANAAARNMVLSQSLTSLNVMVGIASALKGIELDKITFLQIPTRGGLPAPNSGRVEPIYDQTAPIFAKIQNDEPILVNKNTSGTAASASPSASPSSSVKPTSGATPTPTATSLPDTIKATNASLKGCSNQK
jgi:LCP family protein required for cell wall assembly